MACSALLPPSISLGVVSSSRIVRELLPLVPKSPCMTVSAMCVRPESRERAAGMLRSAGLSAPVYTDPERFYAEAAFDFAYVATANRYHEREARAALLAGRNVILEKPFTVSPAKAEALFELAERQGLLLLEAITTPYLPAFSFLQNALPEIGPVRAVVSVFSKRSSRYDAYLAGEESTTFDPANAGGALCDLGIYSIHLIAGLFGAPAKTEYLPNTGRNGVDVSGTLVLRYPGFTACAVCAKDSSAPCRTLIEGERGYLELLGAPNEMESARLTLSDGTVRESLPRPGHRMESEFAAFARILREGDRTAYEAARLRTLTAERILSNARRSAGLNEL
jgi:predicted dehydrogenase